MKILAIESSCDDLAACVLEGPCTILASRKSSQEKVHSLYGGIVPEIASREHVQTISALVSHLFEDLPASERKVEGVAVTASPGLIGSLLVGVNFAKGFALAHQIPVIGVNHLEAHLLSAFLENPDLKFPFLGLVVSGGHTNFYWAKNFGDYELLGSTVDDAAGEAYDKFAKILGLGYPGGPVLDHLASLGNPKKSPFTRARVKRGKYYTSFSGLKTAVVEEVTAQKILEKLQNKKIEEIPEALNLIAAFQKTVVDSLEKLFLNAAEELNCTQWVVAGGVACNQGLRERLKETAQKNGANLFIPSPKFCTDNAEMIAYVGHEYLSRGIHADSSLNPQASGKEEKFGLQKSKE